MTRLTGVALAVVAVFLLGCSGNGDHEGGSHDDGSHDKGMRHGAEMPSMGAQPADMNAKCPVMDEDADPEIFTEYRGKKVYFCCDECVEKFNRDPARYSAKIQPDATGR